MCLYTKNLKPYVAKENIKVFKILAKDGIYYKTPYQGSIVELGSPMKPDKEINYNSGNYGYKKSMLCVEGGFIHAVTNVVDYDDDVVSDNENYAVVEAFIPKGVEFYVSDDFVEIAAKELFITDKIVGLNTKWSKEELKTFLLEYPIENLISKDKVSVGWLMLNDKTFVHPSLFDKEIMQAVGIVCETDENGYNIMSLEETIKQWCEKLVKVEGLKTFGEEKAYTDRKGQEHCKIISKQEEFDNGVFPAVKWCLEYQTEGTKKGDWYLPAVGELRNMILNMQAINASLIWTSVGVTLNTLKYYWSSSAYCSYIAHNVSTGSGRVGSSYKNLNRYVRAFAFLGGNPSL